MAKDPPGQVNGRTVVRHVAAIATEDAYSQWGRLWASQIVIVDKGCEEILTGMETVCVQFREQRTFRRVKSMVDAACSYSSLEQPSIKTYKCDSVHSMCDSSSPERSLCKLP